MCENDRDRDDREMLVEADFESSSVWTSIFIEGENVGMLG